VIPAKPRRIWPVRTKVAFYEIVRSSYRRVGELFKTGKLAARFDVWGYLVWANHRKLRRMLGGAVFRKRARFCTDPASQSLGCHTIPRHLGEELRRTASSEVSARASVSEADAGYRNAVLYGNGVKLRAML
jgi:hypothetical protein